MAADIPGLNIAVIRELLTATFTAENLRRFCRDRSAFRDLLADVPTRASLTETIDVIIDYCTPRYLLPQLLEAVEEFSPKQYDRFAPQLYVSVQAERKSQLTQPVPEESQSQITLSVDDRSTPGNLQESAFEPEATPDSTDSASYAFSSSEKFRHEVDSLQRRLVVLERQWSQSHRIGLKGAASATKEEIESVTSQITVLEQRISIIEKGYEFWDRIKFELGCEACCVQDYWYCIGTISDAELMANDDVHIMLPPNALECLKTAIDSRLFGSFIICEAIEPADADYFDDGSSIVYEAGECIYYLFGSPSSTPSENHSELFLIDSWQDTD